MSGKADDPLHGCKVLIVEDETLVALLLEELLTELGCMPVGIAARYDEALQLAEDSQVDVAILDVNVAGREVYPVAELLAERRIPLIFSTGYGPSSLPERWRTCAVLGKPYTLKDLEKALHATVKPHSA